VSLPAAGAPALRMLMNSVSAMVGEVVCGPCG
jgi:hypothetical protein